MGKGCGADNCDSTQQIAGTQVHEVNFASDKSSRDL